MDIFNLSDYLAVISHMDILGNVLAARQGPSIPIANEQARQV
ncbi:hypothetical protein [Kiloniella litopenaei]|nr:hypothetical protein [Kiloniella litopenaei]